MKLFMPFCFLVFSFGIAQNTDEIFKEIEKTQADLNEEFSNPETTILDSLDFKDFKSLQFYEIGSKISY